MTITSVSVSEISSEMSAELEKLQIGFADPAEKPWLLGSRFLGLAEFAPDGKVGGRPSWLSLSGLPQPSSVACGRCGAPMVFLLQVYAPYHWDHAFHRAVFVFMCRKAECHAPDEAAPPFAVFRSQLERCFASLLSFFRNFVFQVTFKFSTVGNYTG